MHEEKIPVVLGDQSQYLEKTQSHKTSDETETTAVPLVRVEQKPLIQDCGPDTVRP